MCHLLEIYKDFLRSEFEFGDGIKKFIVEASLNMSNLRHLIEQKTIEVDF